MREAAARQRSVCAGSRTLGEFHYNKILTKPLVNTVGESFSPFAGKQRGNDECELALSPRKGLAEAI
jgi:hypothetical protein